MEGQKMKKIISLVLMLAMLLTAVPAMAADTRTSGLYTYEIKGNGTITITDFDWQANGSADVYIPNMIDGYTVTGIGDEAFSYNRNNMDIADSNFRLDDLLTYMNRNSVAVTMPDTIKTIGKKAFWLANISAINVPNSVERIGSGAFFGSFGCLFKVSPSQPNFAVIDNGLYNKSKKELIAYSHFLEEESGTISIPKGIVSLGDYALAYFGSDKERVIFNSYLALSLPSTVTKVGDYTFAGSQFAELFHDECKYLSFPFKEIGDYAFYGARFDVYEVTFISLESVGAHAFDSAEFRNYLKFGKSISTVPDGVFHNIKACGGYSFEFDPRDLSIDTTQIVSIGEDNEILGKKYQSIEDFSSQLTVIPSNMNPQCSELPSTVTTIQSGAFTDVVTDFKLPASLEEIATDAFVKNSTFIVEMDSDAELWCSENGFGYSVEGQSDLDWLTEDLESFEESFEYEEWLYALAGRMGVEADCSSVEAFCNSNIFEMPLNPDALETLLNGCKDKEEFVEEFVIMLEEGDMALFDY